MNDFASVGEHSTGERRVLAIFADTAESRAEQLGIPCSQGVCSCGLPEFAGASACPSAERLMRSRGIVSESPEDVIARVEAVEFCLVLLRNISPVESRALLDYFAGDMEAFLRHTGIEDKSDTESYVAALLEKLAGIIREKNIQPSAFY